MFKTGVHWISLNMDKSRMSWEYAIVLKVKFWMLETNHDMKKVYLNLLSKYKIKKGVFLYVCPDRF